MKVFISWSGETAKSVAELLAAWLPKVLQAVKPFFSREMGPGIRWSNEISKQLEESHVGIVIVTRESLGAPWVMFEAGALSKHVGIARVVPILVDIEQQEIQGPLEQFQSANLNAEGVKRVIRLLNSELRDLTITENVLESAFDKWWPDLRHEYTKLVKKEKGFRRELPRPERDILEELLNLSRALVADRAHTKREFDLTNQAVVQSTGTLSLKAVRKKLRGDRNFAGANMVELDLSGWDLSGINLQGANLVRANLSSAKLVGSNLSRANLEAAVLDKANLRNADISRANLWCASLIKVRNLAYVKSMSEANVWRVNASALDVKTIRKHNTLEAEDYQVFFKHYRDRGMTIEQLRDEFLWTSHAYPNEPLP